MERDLADQGSWTQGRHCADGEGTGRKAGHDLELQREQHLRWLEACRPDLEVGDVYGFDRVPDYCGQDGDVPAVDREGAAVDRRLPEDAGGRHPELRRCLEQQGAVPGAAHGERPGARGHHPA